MKYKFLRKFLGLSNGESAVAGGCEYVFSCGIGWYWGIGGLIVTRGFRATISNAEFCITVKDNIELWRERLSEHTKNAEYDLTVKRAS